MVINEADHGYKCTYPSRKFPCKHSLALMWMRAEGKLTFASSSVPDWVKDWLSRRRPGNQEAVPEPAKEDKPARPSAEEEAPKKADPQAEARSAAARERSRAGRE